jgi:hypothetical protein
MREGSSPLEEALELELEIYENVANSQDAEKGPRLSWRKGSSFLEGNDAESERGLFSRKNKTGKGPIPQEREGEEP